MKYRETVVLKNGAECLLRNADGGDAQEMCAIFRLTHAQTEFLLTYPDENSPGEEQERQFLTEKTERPDEIEICAVVGGRIVGSGGIEAVGRREKLRHRAEFGVGIDRAYWGLGIGRALTAACVECARQAGYAQLELEVVRENRGALALYERAGFREYGRNPRGFRTRGGEWQELILMRMELN